MKRVGLVLVMAILALALLLPGVALAQGTWNTGIDIQNLSGTAGQVTVQFYNANGSSAGQLTDSIGAWGSVNFYLPSESAPASAGQYSAVVSSDVQVGVTASQANYDLGGSDIYLGTGSPENTLSFPLVYRNYTGGRWNTKLVIQNASGSSQQVTLQLFRAGSSTASVSTNATIPGYASYTFDLAGSAFAAFGDFYGSATVSGSAPLAGVADNIRNPGTGALNVIESSYRAFGATQQGRDVVAPLVYKNFNLWTSGINVLNKGGSSTTVTVTYRNANPAVSGGPWTQQITLAGNAMGLFYTPNHANVPNGFYGSAEISSNNTDIAVVVASQRYRTDGAQGVAYEGSLPGDATACVSLPVVHERTTWKTGINIMNLGDAAANVTISYASSAPGIGNASQTLTIPANTPKTVYMPSDSPTALGFYGAADVKSTNGQPLLINAAHSRTGVSANFVGINYTCP